MSKYIKFDSESQRDDFIKAVNNQKTNDGEWLVKNDVSSSGSDYARFERENIRDYEQLGEVMRMHGGKLE